MINDVNFWKGFCSGIMLFELMKGLLAIGLLIVVYAAR